MRMWHPGLLLATLIAASLAPPTGGFGNRKLCGIQLVEALLFVCGEKGLFYHPGRRIKQENLRVMKDITPYTLDLRKVPQKGRRPTKRGIVEQCCHFYCDYYDLENYCNT